MGGGTILTIAVSCVPAHIHGARIAIYSIYSISGLSIQFLLTRRTNSQLHALFSYTPLLILSVLYRFFTIYHVLRFVSSQLRLQYECNPMAYIIEKAGGKATTGTKPILDLQPVSIHDRAPIFIGSTENVDDYLKVQAEYKKK